jgi:hypothetical protein
MTQLEAIVQALKDLGGKAGYSDIYHRYEFITGTILTPGKKAGIRKNIEDHSSDSDNFKGKEDLFYSVEGKGKGVWGLR